jgi:circadian clock protein KaiB
MGEGEDIPRSAPHVFTLYVAGLKPASRRAAVNLRSFCERNLKGKYRITIVDIMDRPQAARTENIVAVPTLVKSWPLPRQVFIGDLSRGNELLSRLDINIL